MLPSPRIETHQRTHIPGTLRASTVTGSQVSRDLGEIQAELDPIRDLYGIDGPVMVTEFGRVVLVMRIEIKLLTVPTRYSLSETMPGTKHLESLETIPIKC